MAAQASAIELLRWQSLGCEKAGPAFPSVDERVECVFGKFRHRLASAGEMAFHCLVSRCDVLRHDSFCDLRVPRFVKLALLLGLDRFDLGAEQVGARQRHCAFEFTVSANIDHRRVEVASFLKIERAVVLAAGLVDCLCRREHPAFVRLATAVPGSKLRCESRQRFECFKQVEDRLVVQRGNVGAAKAIESYDSRGRKLLQRIYVREQ